MYLWEWKAAGHIAAECEAEKDERSASGVYQMFLLLFLLLLSLSIQPTFQVGFPSGKPLRKHTHRHTQKCDCFGLR